MTPAEQTKSLYCMSCGEQTPTYQVKEGPKVELRCSYCGFTLERGRIDLDAALECIILADDELLFRSLLSDMVIGEKLSQEVIACESGAHFLTECVRRFRDQRPISLVILDILMAPMDGSAAAVALRALEKGFDLPTPIPILFVSAVRADDALRRMVQGLVPAGYLNKGKDAAPPRLASRIKEIIPHLFTPVRSG